MCNQRRASEESRATLLHPGWCVGGAPSPQAPHSSAWARRFSGSSSSAGPATDTIYALSSGAPPCAIAVLRISGPQADNVLRALWPDLAAGRRRLPRPRTMVTADLHLPPAGGGQGAGQLLDQALVVRFPGPGSFTGEDAVELHLHGGGGVVAAALGALRALGTAGGRGGGAAPDGPARLLRVRAAHPGEFSKRAFGAGKLSVTQLEGLADLLAARTEAQRQLAVEASSGGAQRAFEAWRAQLLRCLARVEAVIDFGEDAELGAAVLEETVPAVAALHAELAAHLGQAARGEAMRSGLRVALLGPPNSGKSSLLNALAGRPAAIVSPLPGTTRDTVEVTLQLGGYPVTITDSAGLRDTGDAIEAEGMRRARAAARQADVLVWVADGAEAARALQQAPAGQQQPQHGSSSSASRMGAFVLRVLEEAGDGVVGGGQRQAQLLLLLNKQDLLPAGDLAALVAELQAALQQQQQQQQQQQSRQLDPPLGRAGDAAASGSGAGGSGSSSDGGHAGAAAAAGCAPRVVTSSCLTGAGLNQLVGLLEAAVAAAAGGGAVTDGPALAGVPLISRLRHRELVQECVACLAACLQLLPGHSELAAEELRGAAGALGRLTGAHLPSEEVLGAIFGEFCIGK